MLVVAGVFFVRVSTVWRAPGMLGGPRQTVSVVQLWMLRISRLGRWARHAVARVVVRVMWMIHRRHRSRAREDNMIIAGKCPIR